MTVVIGTAGHIDHGKTALLRALTGIDADRLPEERARGMTIDVGYAHLALDDGSELDFVDVPGHDRLVGNMLVGAGEIDAALLVIAADDGPRAQTIEHLELLDALGIADGVVVVTKVDVASPERIAEVRSAVAALLDPTTMRGAPILAASAISGSGLAALRAELVGVRDRMTARAVDADAGTDGRPGGPRASWLAIDRVFSVRGRGTVVTGSLRGAPLERGAVLRVVPAGRSGTARIREIQVHGRSVERAGPGRIALNVAGVDPEELARGVVLTTDDAVVSTDRLLVSLRPSLGRRRGGAAEGSRGLPADRTPVAVHLGTARVAGVVGRSGRDAEDLADGEGSAILRLAHPIAVAPGDRLVVRRASPVETLAGGRVLDPQPPRGVARRRTTAERLRALAIAAAGSRAWQVARLDLHGALAGPPLAMAPDVVEEVDAALVSAAAVAAASDGGIRTAELVRTAGRELRRRVGPLATAGPGVADPIGRLAAIRLQALLDEGRLTRDDDRVLPPGAQSTGPSPALVAAMDRLVDALTPVAPPALGVAARAAGCPPEGIRLLERADRIVRLGDDLAWALATYRELAARALAMAAAAPLTPAAYRDATGTSRKFVLAILEDLDRRAILRRTADGHVPGPRAPRIPAAAANPRPTEAPTR